MVDIWQSTLWNLKPLWVSQKCPKIYKVRQILEVRIFLAAASSSISPVFRLSVCLCVCLSVCVCVTFCGNLNYFLTHRGYQKCCLSLCFVRFWWDFCCLRCGAPRRKAPRRSAPPYAFLYEISLIIHEVPSNFFRFFLLFLMFYIWSEVILMRNFPQNSKK